MAAELKIGIGADNSGLKQGLQDAEAQITAFVNKVGKIGQIGSDLKNIGQQMTIGLTAPLLALGAAAIKSYGDIEALKKGLEAVTGSTAAANSEFIKLKEVSKLPGLGMEEAVRGSINLQAIGLSANNARKILSEFGNAVATVGKGKAEFERAIYGVQQLANTDFPLGEDLNIIKDALPQVSNLLKEAFGTSRSDELTALKISSKQVLDVITAGLEKLPRVTGGIKGAFENLGDAMKTNLARIGDIINKSFDISGIIDKVTGFVDKVITAFESLSPAIQKSILVVAGLAAAMGPLLIAVGAFMQFLPTLLAGIGGISAAMTFLTGPIGLVTIGLIGIVTAVVANWGKIKPYIEGTINYFIDLYNEVAIVRNGVNFLATSFLTLGNIIEKALSVIYGNFKVFGKATLEIFAGIGSVIKGALTLDPQELLNGVTRVNRALRDGLVGTSLILAKTASDFISEQKRMMQSLYGGGEKARIKLDNIEVSDEGVDKVVSGLEKKIKKKKIKIELPDIEPLAPIKTEGFINAFGETFATLQEMENRTAQLASGITTNLAQIPTAFSSIQLSVSENIFKLQESFAAMSDFGNLLGASIQLAFNSVVDTISNSFSAIGEAMATGGNVMNAFGNAILGGIGSFLGDLGKQLIQYGTAALAMSLLSKALLNPITAAPAAVAMIAAGAALSLISGAIKGTLSKGAGSGSSGSGGGFSSAAGGSSTYSSSFSNSGSGMGGDVRFFISGNDLMGVLSRQQDKNTRLG